LERLESSFKRAQTLLPQNAISPDDYDTIKGDRDAAIATVTSSEAACDLAQLDLNYTKVTAPIGGRIGRQLVDPGNLVQGETTSPTALTTIVAVDPIYVYFYVDERTVLRLRRLVRAGVIKSSHEAKLPVQLGLLDEEGFPHEGTINFVDNRDDVNSGTLLIRAIFPNPQRMLSPGLFARVRLPIGNPHRAILISEQALGSDQGQRFVYVVNDEEEAVYRRVKVGSLHDGLRVVEEGLSPEDRVVVIGLQRIRPGAKVVAKMLDKAVQTTAETPAPKSTAPANNTAVPAKNTALPATDSAAPAPNSASPASSSASPADAGPVASPSSSASEKRPSS
jgi:RND family efflux transporter MFP subunit